MSTPAENLLAAKQLLVRHGRIKRFFTDTAGGFCAVGAVMSVVTGMSSYDMLYNFDRYLLNPVLEGPEVELLAKAVYALHLDRNTPLSSHGAVMSANDSPSVSDGKILRAFDLAASMYEGPA